VRLFPERLETPPSIYQNIAWGVTLLAFLQLLLLRGVFRPVRFYKKGGGTPLYAGDRRTGVQGIQSMHHNFTICIWKILC
jgi:hypothetical protein